MRTGLQGMAGLAILLSSRQRKEMKMPMATIVYWRDIPAQVIVKQGRKAAKRELSARFQEAIDMAAMRAKAIGTDDYLNGWRRSDGAECSDDLEAEADTLVARIVTEYDDARIDALVANKGYEDEMNG
jgi:hypothetical protein